MQKLYYEQAESKLLASFTSGLMGTLGKQVGYTMPKNIEEALKIAMTLSQAELQERRSRTLCLDMEGR